MSARALHAATVVALMLAPRAVSACSSCLSSPYGDRGYNFALLGLILTPFVVGVAIAAVFLHLARRRRRADAAASDDPTLNLTTAEETT